MIRKLRYQLVLAAMLSLFLVLFIIIGSASVMNYRKIVKTADNTLQILRDNDGRFPEVGNPSEEGTPPTIEGSSQAQTPPEKPGENGDEPVPPEKPAGEDTAPPEKPAGSGENGTPPDRPADGETAEKSEKPALPEGESRAAIGNRHGNAAGAERNQKELPFESRYFSVFFQADGSVSAINVGRIAAVDEESAEGMAQTVRYGGREKGFLLDYRFIVYEEAGETRILFLDCGRTLDNFRSFIWNSSLVAGLGLLAVFLILLSVSQRIVRPFAESYQKQRQFITDAGHELKTPLTIISADTEILEMDYGENEWLRDIQGQTKRLTELTNHLILLSRMEEDQPKTEMGDFSLSEAAEKTVESFQALAVTQGKSLSSVIEPGVYMHGDRAAIGRLITILLDNAMKYTDEKGMIRLVLAKQRNQIRLSVYNSCEHISKESTQHLFDRFYRTDSSRNSKTGGFGLGLSIAAATVKAHKGKISAATEDEKSLLITATFPEH